MGAALRDRLARVAGALLLALPGPVPLWLGDRVPTGAVREVVAARVRAATQVAAVPLLVLYAVPHRDCGSHSAGGHPSAAAYLAWVEQVAQGLESAERAAVVLEPDALAQLDCLAPTRAEQRMQVLRAAGQRLSRVPGVAVYLDAGNARWRSAGLMARRLGEAGVAGVRGFSLNVANFGRTDEEVRYGREVSERLGGGVPFVVDTGRNGRGRAAGRLAWCNPRGRAPGVPPLSPAPEGVDALLWIKPPGNSDGACRPGEPAAGTFWPEHAVALARAPAG